MSGYKDLKIYQRSYEMAKAVYEMTKSFPREELYGMTSQLRRAALSIPLNIAEGYSKRESQQEFNRFLQMAIGSTNEVLVLMDFSRDVEYITSKQHEAICNAYREIARMISGYIKTVKSKI